MAAHGWRTRDNMHELKQKRFRFAKRRNFFTRRKVRQRKTVPREVVQSSFLKVFKTWMDEDQCNLIWFHNWPSFEQEDGVETSLGPFHRVLLYDLTFAFWECHQASKSLQSTKFSPLSTTWHWCYRPSLVLASLLGYIKEAFMFVDVSKSRHLFLLVAFYTDPLLKHEVFAFKGSVALRFISVQYDG